MYSSETTVRVRYSETDQMQYVYYGNYATYYEVARVETLRELGFVYSQLEDSGIMMPVIECKMRYIKPARYDELLNVKVTIPSKPGVKMLFTYEITNEAGVIVNKGETTLVFVEMKSGNPIQIPDMLNDLFAPFFE